MNIKTINKYIFNLPKKMTFWILSISIIIYYINNVLNIQIPNGILFLIQRSILTICILGTYIVYKDIPCFIKYYDNKINIIHIHILNFILHILPIFLIGKIKKYNSIYELLVSLLIIKFIQIIYNKMYSPSKQYSCLKWSSNKLNNIGYLSFAIICLI